MICHRLPAPALLCALLAALPGAWPADAGAAEPLGRLFLSPERRTALERQRQANVQQTQTLQGAVMSLDGTVRRSSGHDTVWISGTPQYHRDSGTGVAVGLRPGNPAEAVLAPADEPPARLKVGEAINRATREKSDGLDGGTIRGSRRPAD